jgi:hypothetical protein
MHVITPITRGTGVLAPHPHIPWQSCKGCRPMRAGPETVRRISRLVWQKSCSTMLATYLIGHPVRFGLNVVSTLGTLLVATLGANAFCTVTAASRVADMDIHFARLNNPAARNLLPIVIGAYVGHAVGDVPRRASPTCSSLMVEWEVATCIANLIGAVVYEVFQRRAFLVSRWELIGPGGLDRARAWPLGDARGVKMCLGVAASFLYGGAFVWKAFTWSSLGSQP